MIERKIFEKIIASNFDTVELMLSPDCNYSCKYCYMKRFNVSNPESMTIETIDLAINLFKKLHPNKFQLSLFGGEPLLRMDLVEYVLAKTKDDDQIFFISTPNNGSVASVNYEKMCNWLEIYPKLGLSFSVDGIYTDNFQRKHIKGPAVDYDVLFKINKKYPGHTGFHPMIYAETVDTLFDTFKWFVKNVDNNDLVEDLVYFLPVRNGNWTKESIQTLQVQLKQCKQYIKQEKIHMCNYKFNIFRAGIVSRGLTCSLQTCLHVDWDGNVYPCHRLMYPEFHIGNIKNYDEWRFERFLPFLVYHRNNNLLCGSCSISNPSFCIGSCLGANYEYWKDPFIHIPSVCQLLKVVYEEAVDV